MRLLDMFNNKYFNIEWSKYEISAKKDFNITDAEFSWDLVDQKLNDYLINQDPKINKNSIYVFNNLKKNYFNWINILNDNGRFFWDIKLAVISKDVEFLKIWNWNKIEDEAKDLLNNKTAIIDWDLVDSKIFNYVKSKSIYYNNLNYPVNTSTELFIDDIIAVKSKYKDYIFLMTSNYRFDDISKDNDFQKTIKWAKVQEKIKILLNNSNTDSLNMTEVDYKIKQYEFNNKIFTKKEVFIIKDLIHIERQYSDWVNEKNGLTSNQTNSSNGVMSDIGNNIHQGINTISLVNL